MKNTDRLVAAFLAGEPGARAALIEAFEPLASRAARALCYDRQRREDARQAACVGLIEGVDTYDPASGAFRSHIIWRMRGAVLHFNRGTQREKLYEEEAGEALPDIPSAEPGPFDTALAGQRAKMLADAVARLSPNRRRAIALYYGKGISDREVGERMGISTTAANYHRAAAIGELRVMLGWEREAFV